MRHRFRHLTLGLLLVGLACADAPTTPSLRPFDAILKHTELEDFIQAAIDRYLPRGFESAVEARWATVKQKKNAGDLAGSIQQLNTLSLWIDKKTNDITVPTGETVTKGQAAALIILNMARWVYEGAEADPQAVPTGDVAVEIVPAGAPLQMVVPSQHASVVWDAGATQEDRVVVMLEDPGTYTGQCEGPLPTTYCQYPLFYKVESYPHLRLQTPGRMAVYLLTTGDRRPIEYPQDEPGAGEHGPVGERVRLAHQAPPNEADRTPGGVIKGNIEVLPLATSQTGLADCDAPSTLGMGPVEKAMHLAMRYVGKAISPKNAYAYDQGPEHDFSFFSNFNAVDTASAPDIAVDNAVFNPGTLGATPTPRSLSYSISNTSRRSNGGATATARNVFARAYISSNNTLEPGTDFLLGTSNFGVLPPNGTPQPVTHSGFELPIEGPVYLIVTAEQIDGPTETVLGNNMVVLDLNANQVGDGLIGVWNGNLAPPNAPAGTGQPATFVVTTLANGTCTGEFRVASSMGQPAYNLTRSFTTCSVEGSSVYADINPWQSTSNNAVRSQFNMTFDGDGMVGTAVRSFPSEQGPMPEQSPWTLTLTRGVIPIVPLPPTQINAVAGIRMQNSTSETPAVNWY
jgi:hypothetical protein